MHLLEQMMNENIQESFLFRYGELEEIKIIQNKYSGYTSQALREFLIKAIKKSRYNEYATIIEKMIRKKLIIPVTFEHSWFDAFFAIAARKAMDFEKFKENIEKYSMAGYFTAIDNKVYIMLSNTMENRWGLVDDDRIASDMIHEVMHFCASNRNSDFYGIWSGFFSEYYYNYYNLIYKFYFKKNMTSKNQHVLRTFINKVFLPLGRRMDDQSVTTDKKLRVKVFKELMPLYIPGSPIQTLMIDDDSSEIRKKTVDSMILYPLFFLAFNGLTNIDKLFYGINEYVPVQVCSDLLKYAYKSVHCFHPDISETQTYQELFVPSEVAAISSISDGSSQFVKATLSIIGAHIKE